MFETTLSAGEYDRRVTIQSATNSTGAIGGTSASWADVATVWAKVRALTGKELERLQEIAVAPRMVIIRWRTGIDATMRVVFEDGSIGRILWTQELGYRAELALAVEAVEVTA